MDVGTHFSNQNVLNPKLKLTLTNAPSLAVPAHVVSRKNWRIFLRLSSFQVPSISTFPQVGMRTICRVFERIGQPFRNPKRGLSETPLGPHSLS